MNSPHLLNPLAPSQPGTPPQAVGGGRSRSNRRRGIGLAELLISLSISAALLTAVAVAIDASFKAYSINQEQSDLMQRARLAVHRITTMIRQTKEHAPENGGLANDFSTGATVTDSGIDMMDLNDNEVTYSYDKGNKRLLAIVNNKKFTLASGVEDFQVRMEPMRSAESIRTGGGWDLLKRATVLITVRTTSATATKGEGVDKQTVTLSASVMPRRNAW
jgi:hypothetical protein